MKYEKGEFTFEWNELIREHILDLKTISKFKCSYSWTLYEKLKAIWIFLEKFFKKRYFTYARL